MTDITDQDKREARKWAEQTIANRVNSPTDPWVIAARLFLAAEEPPAPTLAEELREWAEKRYSGVVGTGKHELMNLATRAEQIEQDLDEARAAAKTWQEQDENDCEIYSEEITGLLATLAETREALAVEGRRVEKRTAERDEARAEVERLTEERDVDLTETIKSEQKQVDLEAEVERLTAERESREMALHEHGRLLSEARAEVERLTAEVYRLTATVVSEENVTPDQQSNPKETLADSLPDPADVSPGEAWMVEVDGEQFNAVKDKAEPLAWNAVDADGLMIFRKDSEVTLLRRLVPAPRVITDPDELEQLAATSIIRDGRGWPGGVTDQGVTMINGACLSDEEVLSHGPVTVLWEAES